MPPPDLPGVLSAGAVVRTVATIAGAQQADGMIPWWPGSHGDPWDHVEAAMALDIGGRHDDAGRAYDWLQAAQAPDGSWPARTHRGTIVDATREAHHAAYTAVGVWHRYLATGDREELARRWPMVAAAVAFVLGLQHPDGQVRWARDAAGRPHDMALLSASACTELGLRCAVAVGAALDVAQPDWELAADRLGERVATCPQAFAPKHRWSMDWYYPVLCGAVTGRGAAERLAERWHEFVMDGWGARCVADRPWVTGAESCELALALDAAGQPAAAADMLAAMQHLRADDGSYWMGYVVPDGVRWPVERTTWTAAAVVLAADAIADTSSTAPLFRRRPADHHPEAVRSRTRSEPTASRSANAPLSRARR